jgi:hypothetical protein
MRNRNVKIALLSIGCLTMGLAGGDAAAKKPEKQLVIVPPADAKFGPLDPRDPAHSPQVALLWGDQKNGPVAFLLKTKGPAPLHWHTSDYWAISVEGTTRHWLPGKEADAKDNPPNTFWFQPGGAASSAHFDNCVTASGCTMFVYMTKGQDFFPVMDKATGMPVMK